MDGINMVLSEADLTKKQTTAVHETKQNYIENLFGKITNYINF